MGYTGALDFASLAGREQALIWHLQSNHYPPVPVSMVGPCIEAIEAIEQEDDGRLIDLPEPVLYKGEPKAPAWAIFEQHHLQAFVDADDPFMEDEDEGI